MGKVKDCRVLQHAAIAEDTMFMRLDFGAGEHVLPGMFIHIRAFNRPDLILRRPISVNSYDAQTGYMDIVYQVKGKGTQALASAHAGDTLDVYGPAGNGFTLPDGVKRVLLIGGGIGCAPLKYLPEYYSIQFDAVLGFKNAGCIYQQEDFRRLCRSLDLVTDDGSAGDKGFVTDRVNQLLQGGETPDAILACGPEPMLKALRSVVDGYDLPCFASLEQRMGCGMGACYTCTCATVSGNARVCADGPVFNIKEVF